MSRFSNKQPRLRRSVRLAQLELLAALDHAPTLSAAAAAARMAQPAASRLLRNLAEDIDIQLFERFGRTLRPTPAGRILMQRASRLVADLDRIEEELEGLELGLSGTVCIGSGIASCYELIPNSLRRMLEAAPQIAIELREGSMDELTAILREGRIDLLVGRLESSGDHRDLHIEDLYDPPTVIVCGTKHPLARKRTLTWDDVLRESWILPDSGTPMRSGIENLFRLLGSAPRQAIIESSAIQANLALSRTLPTVWALSYDIAKIFSDAGALHILPLPHIPGPSPFVVSHLRDRKLSSSASILKDCIKIESRKLFAEQAAERIFVDKK